MHPLTPWGWNAAVEASFVPHAASGLVPARVLEEHRDRLVVASADGGGAASESSAELSGRLAHEAQADADLPAVGDFVALEPGVASGGAPGRGVVRAVLPRRSVLVRRAAGRSRRVAHRAVDVEVVAANLDYVLVLTSLNADFSPRRVERFLAQVWEGGAQPVVVLTKADLSAEVDARRAATEAVAPGVPVHSISALRGEGLDTLAPYLGPGVTSALVGSSGVGKSTLVNALFGRDVQVVRALREHDETGVHTTTSRRLFLVPSGGCVADTPGMRELGLVDAGSGVDAAFADVTSLAPQCRFRDCVHASEPACAVRAAIERGDLPEERLDAWRHLRRELAFVEAKERKRDRLALRGPPARNRADLRASRGSRGEDSQ